MKIIPWLVCLLALGVVTADAAPSARPNIIFILADDLGWSDTTLYGGTKFHQTPNLERLAKRGMVFNRAYSASPLCSPTRASILTGQSPARIGITAPVCHVPEVKLAASVKASAPANVKTLICDSATRLTTNHVTIATVLKQAGYATGHFGKWHLGREPYSALQHGFDVDVPHHPGPGPAGSYVAPWKFPNFNERTPGEHIEDRMCDEAIAFLEQHKSGPFYLNYWMFSVHAPFDAKKSYIDNHRPRVNPNDPQRSPTYAAMIQSMDENIGRLLDALDRLGLSENTAILFYSDNGGNMYNEIDGTTPTSNTPLRGGKATLYEGGIRVPCVVSWPGVTRAGTRSDAVIQSSDFHSTIIDLLGLKPASGHIVDGISIAPALRGQPLARSEIFTFFPHATKVPDMLPAAVTVHSGDWKLIRLFHEGERGAHAWRLYNLAEDQGEQHDLAALQQERVKELDARIEKFLADTKAVVPRANPAFRAGPVVETASASPADPLDGWKSRGGDSVVKDGVLTMTGSSSAPFLGFAAGRFSGPAKVTMRARAKANGEGKVEWVPSAQPTDKAAAKSVPFQLTGGDWREIAVDLPASGPLGILRLYLPAAQVPVELDWVELEAGKNKRRWNF